ncbi:MAG: hypothetical protein GY953_28975, partial [bacterium]|nr:hypothetical protein [bacterium]
QLATLEKVQLPKDLRLTIRLETPISSKSAVVGERLRAVTSFAVKHKRKTVLPAGATLKGRIRWLEQRATNSVLGLEFSTVEWEGKQARFLARLDGVRDPSGRLRRYEAQSVTAHQLGANRVGYGRVERTQQVESFQIRDLPGVAMLMVSGRSFELPAGVQLTWITEEQ